VLMVSVEVEVEVALLRSTEVEDGIMVREAVVESSKGDGGGIVA
jgi:hypothetical protein